MNGRVVRIALAGNPNVGKTTLFNRLTGSRHRVANYPGTTVETREGRLRAAPADVVVVDLPGTYALGGYTDEERVARAALTEPPPDLVVQVVDASNLERNLYLTMQLFEAGLPVVLALNMSDAAAAQGIEVDRAALEAALGIPVVPTVAHEGRGVPELAATICRVLRQPSPPRGRSPVYDEAIERAVENLAATVVRPRRPAEPPQVVRWRALLLLEHEGTTGEPALHDPEVAAAVERARRQVTAASGATVAERLAAARYANIAQVCALAVRRQQEPNVTRSDRLDRVLAHPVWGAPVFLAVMYAMFTLVFRLGDPPMRWLEARFEQAGAAIRALWPDGRALWVESLLVDGVLAGVGGVLAFVPNILLLFGAIALLEDSGYLARAALLSDRLMRRIGLHGRSFIPLLIGFGCTVPAILATRTLETRRDRLTTMLILPLISCGARLPIYSLLIPAFFPPRARAPMLFGLYLTGIALAVLAAMVLRRTVFRGDPEPLLLELPPYRRPSARAVLAHMLDRGWMYVRKAGTLILAISMVLWALTRFPRPPAGALEGRSSAEARAAALAHSAAGRVGRAIEPLLRPMGFDWRIGTAMIGAFAAKEVFVAQLGIVFAVGEDDPAPLRERLQAAYPPRTGLCMMLFMLIGTPCMATVAVTRRESGSWRWAMLQFGGLTALAWLVTTAVNQILRLLGG
ncbi:MAG: ferrous iron transport protein B [Kiritimatiellae bacterium]|nr:ferrous iron transport protein B [Kiritimatiellia bacterium]